ncbi:DUF6795 domain-containing protein [Trinickia sp. EG282A]|uniref:DUF6795 domain-containing protein n=1 Tax=Trinickia sp. EG282A TaxID=3237013 RepID=UPI0034D3585F
MGVFDRLVLFSEVHGTVLMDGKPVQGAELVEQVIWSENENEIPPQRCTTDARGAFRFPAIERRAGLRRLIHSQPVVLQRIVIRYRGGEYIGWRNGKTSWDANTELDGRPIELVCELDREPGHEGTHYGICQVA